MSEPAINDSCTQAAGDRPVQYEATLAEPLPERYSYEAAVNGEYPALCDNPDCKPCAAAEAAWSQEEVALDAAWRREELERVAAAEATANEPEAGL